MGRPVWLVPVYASSGLVLIVVLTLELRQKAVSRALRTHKMGGYGSGRSGGRPTVESAVRLDIDAMIRWGGIEPGAHVRGEMTFDVGRSGWHTKDGAPPTR
jgi:hypothetical protein